MKKQWHVGILLFDNVDVLDYSGPFEVFSLSVHEDSQVQQLLMKGIPIEGKPFVVKTISHAGKMVTTNNGLKIVPDFNFENVNQVFDIVLVPGGPFNAINSALRDKALINWVTSQYKAGRMVISVCTGALLLAEAGLLRNKKATTNQVALDYLERKYPDINVIRNGRFVDAGDVMTSAGISAGIDMSLYMVGKLLGEEAARRTASTIEYPYWDGAITVHKTDQRNIPPY